MSVNRRLLLALLLILLFPLLLTHAVLYFSGAAVLTERVLNQLESVASIQHHRVEARVAQNLERLALVANRTQLRLSLASFRLDHDERYQVRMNRVLDDALEAIEDFETISVLDRSGRVAASTDRQLQGRDFSQMPCFREGKKRNRVDLFHRDQGGHLSLHMAGPLKLRHVLIGVIVIRSSARDIVAPVDDYSGLGKTGETVLATRTENGDALFLVPTRFDRDAALLRRVSKRNSTAPIMAALAGREQPMSGVLDYRGQRVLCVTRNIEETGWGLVVKMDEAEARAPLAPMRTMLVVVFALSSLVVAVVAVWLARSITLPLSRLTVAAGKIGARDLAATVEATSADEVGELARTLDAARASLKVEMDDRRKAEEQLRLAQKMEAVGRLAGGVAHDFNNLLTVIAGYADILLERLDADDPLYSKAAAIAESGDKAALLVEQLLAFSRRQEIRSRPVSLNDVVVGMESMLHRIIGEDVLLRTELDPDLGLLEADPIQLDQIIMNLAINARDAMPSGGTLTLATENFEPEEAYRRQHADVSVSRYVGLVVTDSGSGMEPDTQARAFEPFFTTKAPGEGTGLGLSTLYGIVTQGGGHVTVNSTPGQGTTFRVYFPRFGEEIGESTDEDLLQGPTRGKETVVVVEDEDSVREYICEALDDLGYHVRDFGRAQEAFDFCVRETAGVDLVLTDVIMPEMGGRELAERLGGERPDLKVLYMSGYTTERFAEDDGLEESTFFIQKPFTPSALGRKIRELLDDE